MVFGVVYLIFGYVYLVCGDMYLVLGSVYFKKLNTEVVGMVVVVVVDMVELDREVTMWGWRSPRRCTGRARKPKSSRPLFLKYENNTLPIVSSVLRSTKFLELMDNAEKSIEQVVPPIFTSSIRDSVFNHHKIKTNAQVTADTIYTSKQFQRIKDNFDVSINYKNKLTKLGRCDRTAELQIAELLKLLILLEE